MFALPMWLLVLSCGDGPSIKKNDDSASSAVTQTYVVKGDPRLLVAGASLRPQSPFTEENLGAFEDYSLDSLVVFAEKEKLNKEVATQASIEKENAPRDGSQLRKKYDLRMKVSKMADGSWVTTVNTLKVGFLWTRSATGRLELTGTRSEDGATEQLKVLHWSQSHDRSKMSVLVESMDSVIGKTLSAIYFVRNSAEEIKIPEGSPLYQYTQGPGVTYAWDAKKVLEVHLCGAPSAQKNLSNAVGLWQNVLKGRLQIRLTQPPEYFPFSDLNQHCVYVVDNYLVSTKENEATYGTTITSLNKVSGRIIDSDIFIFKGEFEKLKKKSGPVPSEAIDLAFESDLTITYIHELGHLLGLGHKFDGTPSVMSYKYDSEKPTKYDVEAIQALYPLQRP